MLSMMNTQPIPLDDDGAVLAVDVLRKYIDKLPLNPEDKRDLWGFVGDWFGAGDDDDREYIKRAILEILGGPRGGVSPLPLDTPQDRKPEGYQKWVKWIGGEIQRKRSLAGLTQQQLADKSGLPQSHISRIENGIHSPSQATLGKIAAALDLPLSAFDLLATDDAA
jgi:DNA-binding XRE family transcriptional regulator